MAAPLAAVSAELQEDKTKLVDGKTVRNRIAVHQARLTARLSIEVSEAYPKPDFNRQEHQSLE